MTKFQAFKRAAIAVVIGAPVLAHAAIPADVTDALADAAADVTTMGGLVLVVLIGAATFKYLRRAM